MAISEQDNLTPQTTTFFHGWGTGWFFGSSCDFYIVRFEL